MSRAADLIMEARRRSGLSQAELARRSGVARPIVNAYERNRREPSVAAVERLLAAAGCRLVVASAVRVPDPERAGRHLRELLDLAEAIPTRPAKPLIEFPPFLRT